MASKLKPPSSPNCGPDGERQVVTCAGARRAHRRSDRQRRQRAGLSRSPGAQRGADASGAPPRRASPLRLSRRSRRLFRGRLGGKCAREIADVHSNGRTPILVGGTGLYLRTLLDGIAPVPSIDPAVRKRVREACRGQSRQAGQTRPRRRRAIETGRHPRIARALEVVQSTGRTLADWQTHREGGIGDAIELRPLVLLPPRDRLYRRCDERFERMFDSGAIEEVQALLARNLDPNLPVMRDRGAGDRGLSEWRAVARRGDRRRAAGDAPLRQAPIYLVRASAAAALA